MTDAGGHQTKLAYTIDDDGIWIMCNCGWKYNLGFDATPQLAMSADKIHRIVMNSNEPKSPL